MSTPGLSMDRVADVLGRVRQKGVTIWAENGRVRYKAPKGVLTLEEIETLKTSRDSIAALLEGAVDRTLVRRIVPLTYSQQGHWHLYELSEKPSLRGVVSATRIRGRLNIDALQTSLAAVVRRHDALRTRIVLREGAPSQEISASGECELIVGDLLNLPESYREEEVIRLIGEFILQPVNVTTDELFGIRLLKVRNDEHVLTVAMEHLISDGYSRNVFLRDLFSAYSQVCEGVPVSLPPIPVQFSDYAVLQKTNEESWIKEHGAYWTERMAGCERLRFPVDRDLPSTTRLGLGVVPLHIGADLKLELREWCRLRRTTLVMGAFAAYVALVLRWCNVPEAVIQFQTDGRANPGVENAIGYFASSLYLRIALDDRDTFVDLLNKVTAEYCRAYEHADFSYLDAQDPRPGFTRNSCFNWVPQGPGAESADGLASENALEFSPVIFPLSLLKDLERDTEPVVVFAEVGNEVLGGVHFPLNRFSGESMERFGRNYLLFVDKLLRKPGQRLKTVSLM